MKKIKWFTATPEQLPVLAWILFQNTFRDLPNSHSEVNLMVKIKSPIKHRIVQKVIAGILVILVISSCSLLPGSSSEEPQPELDQPEITLTATETRIPWSSPTNTLVPSETPIPSETIPPTERPTWTPFPTKTLRPTWTASPTLSPTATKEVGWILKDDFSEVSPWWYKKDGGNWGMGYAQGGYFMSVEDYNVEITSTQSWLKLGDVRVIVDVFKNNGQGYWGISCREVVAGSYYTIFVTHKGEYGWGETRQGKISLNILGTSDLINTARGSENVYQLMAECRGNTLKLFVDGTLLFQQTVEAIGPGWVGMMIGTQFDKDRLVVVFDNIEIWGPIEDEP